MNTTTRNVWELTVCVSGVKRGERKTKNHRFPLGETTDDGTPIVIGDDYADRAAFLVREKMRAVVCAHISACPVKLVSRDGIEMTSRMLLDPRQVNRRIL